MNTGPLAPHSRPPWWRDEQILKTTLQFAFALIVVLALVALADNLRAGLAKQGLSLGFSFLSNSANFGISEGIPYDPSESYFKAFLVGVVNTIWVCIFSIALAMTLGLILGMARLSSNWLARQLATVVTEVFRNIPVLLIVIFWYQAVLLQFPGVRDSYSIFDIFFLSQRGLNFPALTPSYWLIPTVIGAGIVFWGTRRSLDQRADLAAPVRGVMPLVGGILIILAFQVFAPQAPLELNMPELTRFNFQGGGSFSAEFLALMMGLVTYTGAYIAEVVRGAFMSVPKGQWEASRALGFSELKTFQLVIVPQALRIMIPSLNTQFQTLIKNSSLAIAVGYSDMFNVSSTVINQSGRSVEVFAMMMAAYLLMNMVVSYSMNWLNYRVRLVER